MQNLQTNIQSITNYKQNQPINFYRLHTVGITIPQTNSNNRATASLTQCSSNTFKPQLPDTSAHHKVINHVSFTGMARTRSNLSHHDLGEENKIKYELYEHHSWGLEVKFVSYSCIVMTHGKIVKIVLGVGDGKPTATKPNPCWRFGGCDFLS